MLDCVALFVGFVTITSVIPNNLLIAEGGTAQFNITAISIGELSYQWKKRNVNRLPEKVLGEDTPVLRIPNLDKSDEGLYYCIVTNVLNISAESINITLTVYGRLVNMSFYMGKAGLFYCMMVQSLQVLPLSQLILAVS